MNISSLGMTNLSVTDTQTMNAVDIAMLKKSLDTVETGGEMITQMMERSINPNIGGNIDIRL
ncbi:MAG: YjfB family protein [Lachnospiraceae bacterium]|nr:YjfB family protein [Lachnospiraceae bacterium]